MAVNYVGGQYEYTRRRPSRRQQPGMPVMPGMIQPIPEIAIVIDTSGSMSDEMLTEALSEVDGILQTFGQVIGLQVFSVDDAVGAVERVYDIHSVRLVGDGGTNMGVGIQAAMESAATPNIIIILTDGYTPWPRHPPDAITVVGVIGDPKRVLKTGKDIPFWVDKVVWINE
jgi:predicted metal-dependent peptidase